MKRLFLVLSVLLSIQIAGAQSKATLDAVSNVDKAKEATENPKKATKSATWIKLGDAYVKAYEAPTSNIVVGMSKPELQLLMAGENPVNSSQKVIGQQPYIVEEYQDKILYFDGNGMLTVVEVTKPAYTDIDPLEEAVKAFLKAGELETKESGRAKIAERLNYVASKYFELAMNKYTLGDAQGASDTFVKSLIASENPVANKVDTLAIYNAGFTASEAGDTTRAITMFEKCLAVKHYENGDVFARLGDLYVKTGQKDKGREVLEAGFKEFPSSQAIIISLINYYLESKENTDRLFELISEAKANEPNNASLYYVEGEIYKGLGDRDKALECYYKSFDIDNNYVFGLYAAGAYWYDEAVRVSELAQAELDDQKYLALVEEFEGYMINAIEPFEKLFASTEDLEFRRAAAEYLKSIYFRFRDRDPKYLEGYEKYNSYLESL